MRKLLSIALIIAFSADPLFSCTTFFIHKNGQFAFGRNYDWITETGMMCSNLRGLAKTSLKMSEGSSVTLGVEIRKHHIQSIWKRVSERRNE